MGAEYISPNWLLPNNENKDKASNYSIDFEQSEWGNAGLTSKMFSGSYDLFTLSVWWTKTSDNPPNEQQLLGSTTGGTFMIRPDLSVVDIFTTSGNYGTFDFSVATGQPNGEWYNLTMVYDGSGADNPAKMKAWLNGVPQTLTFTGTIPTSLPFSSTKTFMIGRGPSIPTSYYGFAGKISDVAIWTGSDKSSEVPSIYNSGTVPDYGSAGLNSNWWYRIGKSRLVENVFYCPTNDNLDKTVGNYSYYTATNNGKKLNILGNPSSLQINGQALSISIWAWSNYQSGGHAPFFAKGTSGNEDYSLGAWGVSSNAVEFIIRSGGTEYSLTGGTAIKNLYPFHHILATYDGNDMKIYLDGVLDGTNTIGAKTIDNNMSASCLLGYAGTTYNSSYMNLSTCAIYDTGLSASDAVALYNNGIPINESSSYNPVAYWIADNSMWSGSYWTLYDEIGSANATGSYNTSAFMTSWGPNGYNNFYSTSHEEEDKVGNAPSSSNNSISYNMGEEDRVEDVPS